MAGPYPGSDRSAGDYNGIVTLTMPEGAGTPTIDGDRSIAVLGQDGPTRVVGTLVNIPRDESTELKIEFDLPTSWQSMLVLPSARVPPINWTAGDKNWTDTQPIRVQLDDLS